MRRFAALLLAATIVICGTPAWAAADSGIYGASGPAGSRSGEAGVTVNAMYGSMYQVIVTGAADAARVQVPVWSEENGQDDLVWYEAHPNSGGTWTVEVDTALHGGGRLSGHAYADGKFAGGLSFEAPVPDWPGVLALPGAGSVYTVLVSNLPDASEVRMAVWSAAYGQDDLRWYGAQRTGSTWSVQISTARHGGGELICHVYSGEEAVGGVTFAAPAAWPSVRTELRSGTRYDVVIENLWGAEDVQVPTWGTAGGQDDMIWYGAVKTAPGTWRASLNAANHDEGTVSSHVYADGRCIDCSVRVRRDFLTVNDLHGGSTYAPDISSLPRTKMAWGFGGPKDSSGRPEACTSYQAKYGHYGADFIAPDSTRIYLTLDEGYENGYTAEILDVLKEKGVHAVFFVTYPFVKERPQLVQRMIDEGHQVGNHSATHPSFPSVSLNSAFREIMQTHRLVQQQFGYDMKLFRFPSGEFSERDLALLQALGYRSVFWSYAYHDWEPTQQIGAAAALQKATKALHPGAIYLLHAVSRDNRSMMGDFIDNARARGYEFASYDLT